MWGHKQYHYFVTYVSYKDGKQSFGHIEWLTRTKIVDYMRVKEIERSLKSSLEVDELTLTSFPHLMYAVR